MTAADHDERGFDDEFEYDVRDEEERPHRGRAFLGWAVVALLAVLVVVLTVVLAGMLLVVSVWLTVAVPLVVLAAVVGVVAFARRGG